MAYTGGVGGKMSAVDAILAEAADMIALEQIAKLNTAHLADDSGALPSTLESRFRKLKSLPAAPAPAAPVRRTLGRSVTAPHPTLPDPPRPSPPPDQHQQPAPAPAPASAAVQEEQPPGDAAAEKKGDSSPPRRPPAAVPAAQHDDEDDLDTLFGSGARGRPTLRERNRGRDDDGDGGSLSPPPPRRQACCFGFSSPRKPLQRTPTAKGKKVHGSRDGDALGGIDAGEWGDENRRMVAELKEQQRKLKKALEEQVKVSRETAKMASWVKQASARMTHTAAIDDLLSDCNDDDDEELK